MPTRRVVVFGGTGFLGRRVVARLRAEGEEAVVAARRPPTGGLAADITDPDSVVAAVAGADAAVNCVGLYVESGAATFDAVHVNGARHVALAARRAGLSALVHLSGVGADAASRSRYIRARAEGEVAVREAFPAATILRPSVMFGPDDGFLNGLAGLARLAPVIPLFGSGAARLQPVFVDDVAAAVVQALDIPTARGIIFELGGPETVSYRDLVERVLMWTGRRRLLLPFPFAGWALLARLAALLPSPPITDAQVELMRHDNVVAPGAPGFDDLDLTPTPMGEVAPRYLAR